MEIVDAWMQHPGPEFIGDPMFDSLRRWKSNEWSEGAQQADGDAGLVHGGHRRLADNARRAFRL